MAIPALPAHGANWDAWAAGIDAAARAGGGSNLAVATTVTASGALSTGKHNPVNATSGAKAMTLPTGAASGTLLSVEKTDATTNAVTVTGNVRGVGATSISLVWQNESLLLAADSAGSWWPIAGHKTKTSLDAAYALAAVGSYTYNPDGTVAAEPNGKSYTYNADGTVHTETLNGVTRTYSYDANFNVTAVA